jgi:hypothetical protein
MAPRAAVGAAEGEAREAGLEYDVEAQQLVAEAMVAFSDAMGQASARSNAGLLASATVRDHACACAARPARARLVHTHSRARAHARVHHPTGACVDAPNDVQLVYWLSQCTELRVLSAAAMALARMIGTADAVHTDAVKVVPDQRAPHLTLSIAPIPPLNHTRTSMHCAQMPADSADRQ